MYYVEKFRKYFIKLYQIKKEWQYFILRFFHWNYINTLPGDSNLLFSYLILMKVKVSKIL